MNCSQNGRIWATPSELYHNKILKAAAPSDAAAYFLPSVIITVIITVVCMTSVIAVVVTVRIIVIIIVIQRIGVIITVIEKSAVIAMSGKAVAAVPIIA